MRYLRVILSALLCWCMTLLIPAQAQDVLSVGCVLLSVTFVSAQESEDNDTILFPLLQSGEAVVGTFEGASTMQLYAFNGLQGDVVNITMTPADDTIDPFLILLGQRGEVIAYNDDSLNAAEGERWSEIEAAELPADGSYLVVATDWRHLNTALAETPMPTADYQVTMTGASDVEIPEGESPIQLAGVQAGIGQSGNLDVTFNEPVYYVFFSADEGQTVTVETSEAAGVETPLEDTMLWVFDRSGARISAADDIDGSGHLYATAEFEAEYTGAYMAFAAWSFFYLAPDSATDDEFFGSGTFTISIEEG